MKKVMLLSIILLTFSCGNEGIISEPIEPEMVFVEGGTFVMGCYHIPPDLCCKYSEPLHRVTLSSFI